MRAELPVRLLGPWRAWLLFSSSSAWTPRSLTLVPAFPSRIFRRHCAGKRRNSARKKKRKKRSKKNFRLARRQCPPDRTREGERHPSPARPPSLSRKYSNQVRSPGVVHSICPLTRFLAARFTLSSYRSTRGRSDPRTNAPWNFISSSAYCT